MADFKTFAKKVNKRFEALQAKQHLFSSSLGGDELYAAYLAAFPEGTNPALGTSTEHDCRGCKAFVRTFGRVIHVDPQTLEISTTWKIEGAEFPYDVVASTLDQAIRAAGVGELFRTPQASYSKSQTISAGKLGGTVRYDHLHGVAAPRLVSPGREDIGEHQTAAQVLSRSFSEFTADALDTVGNLIATGELYRGEQNREAVKDFTQAFARYHALSPELRERFVKVSAMKHSLTNLPNSSVGTLISNLSQGMDRDRAVRAYNSIVAPQNYQRTSQVITQNMVKQAEEALEALGVQTERRMATLADVSVNNVLWVDRAAKPLMKGGALDILSAAVKPAPTRIKEDNVTKIGIEAFLTDVLPRSTELRVLVQPELSAHFVTLTTGKHERTEQQAGGAQLFKWDNDFAWSYDGDVTDSITQRVKDAGGNTNALLRFSLSWGNTDDLDLHLHFTPEGGRQSEHIYFGHRTSHATGLTGGLDVDMNIHGETREAVENIAFTRLAPGTYRVQVNNYTWRENRDVGFTLQVAQPGKLSSYQYDKKVGNGQTVDCLTARVDRQGQVTYTTEGAMKPLSSETVGEKWGVPYGQFAPVRCVMLSPNHWDEQKEGNRHWFFILKDARTNHAPRSLYNEYLHPSLHKHRKVFDVLGERGRPELQDEQLSGVGVSSTLRRTIVAEVTQASGRRTYQIEF